MTVAVQVYGFERALKPVLVIEGGKVDDPADPGGRTNQGITQRVYTAYRNAQGSPARDVYQMTDRERDAIYRQNYWNLISGDRLREGVGYAVFDGAVHSGVSQAVKWLQRALGPLYSGAVDGTIGALTLAALDAVTDDDALIGQMLDLRLQFMRQLKGWGRFGNGWTRRIEDLRDRAQAWASGSVGPAPEYLGPSAGAKADGSDAKGPTVRAPGDLAAGMGAGGLVLSPVVNDAKDQLLPYAGSAPWVDKLILYLIIISAVLAVAGIGWRLYAAWQTKRRADALGVAT